MNSLQNDVFIWNGFSLTIEKMLVDFWKFAAYKLKVLPSSPSPVPTAWNNFLLIIFRHLTVKSDSTSSVSLVSIGNELTDVIEKMLVSRMHGLPDALYPQCNALTSETSRSQNMEKRSKTILILLISIYLCIHCVYSESDEKTKECKYKIRHISFTFQYYGWKNNDTESSP